MKSLFICSLFLLSSCAFIYSGNKGRKVQTQIMRLIGDKNKQFAACAKNNDIFKELNSNRVPVTIFLEVNKKGELEKFQLDNKEYPVKFTDCIFDVVELISFPKNDEHELIKIEQPFIFSAKN